MADMRWTSRGDGGRPESGSADRIDRAQLILITGLTLAVILVAVVLLLNTVIYTENLATRGVDAGGAEAAEFREGTVTDVGAIMDRENRNGGTDATDLTATVETYADRVHDHRLRDGVLADVTLDDGTIVDGRYVAQDRNDDGTHRNFTADDTYNETDDGNWTLVENATATRGYRFTIDADSVHELGGNETYESDAFAVVIENTDSTASWTLYAYNESGSSNVTLTVNGTSGGPDTFEAVIDEDGTVDIDLTAGTVNGERWDELVWAEGIEDGVDQYDVSYENGHRAAGTYELTVEESGATDVLGDDDRFGTPPDGTDSSPYALDAVYSVEVTVGHRTPDLRYEDRVRVAPGERDD